MYILYYSEKSFQTFSPTLSTLVNQNYCEQNEQSTSNLEYPHCLGVTHYHPLVQQYKYDCKDGLIKHVKTHESGMDLWWKGLWLPWLQDKFEVSFVITTIKSKHTGFNYSWKVLDRPKPHKVLIVLLNYLAKIFCLFIIINFLFPCPDKGFSWECDLPTCN